MNQNYTILHLYSDTMDLYGDSFNVTAIANRLREMGDNCEILCANLGDDFDPMAADLIYMGHGKARNLAAIAPHFLSHGAAIKEAVEAGKIFLVTGSSRMLFGESFETYAHKIQEGLGLFPYTGVETGQVFTGDVVAHTRFDPSLRTYGFVNRTAYLVGENTHPLFDVQIGPGDGDGASAADHLEGTLYRNFFGTWQMGPLLARNPGLLREILRRLTGSEPEYDDSLEKKALELTLSEFDHH